MLQVLQIRSPKYDFSIGVQKLVKIMALLTDIGEKMKTHLFRNNSVPVWISLLVRYKYYEIIIHEEKSIEVKSFAG